MEQLKGFFTGKEINSILDVGTGSGDFLAVLKNVFPDAKIVGIDPNTESLKEAAGKYPEVSFIEMSGESLDFEDNTFDLVSISMAIHHLPDIQKTLSEMKRVVKQDRWIIVNELFSDNLNPAQEMHKMLHHFRSKIDRLTGIHHHETFEKAQILKIVKEAGIQVLFDFENMSESHLVTDTDELEIRIGKMTQHLEKIKDQSEYEGFKTQIDKFRKGVLKYGFQPATRIVIVGKPT